MGKEIEKAANEQDISITNIFEIDNKLSLTENYDFDVAIDFSFPSSVLENVEKLAKLKKNIVLGTTGWNEHFELIKNIVEREEIGLVYSSNFSLGMQIFKQITKKAAELVNNFDDYDIFLQEIHHKRKKDSPSGTALNLADIIIEKVIRKEKIQKDTLARSIQSDELHVSSLRGGEITGTHTIFIDSSADTIELTHRAKNRSGFAKGAIYAAKWIYGKKGMFDFEGLFIS